MSADTPQVHEHMSRSVVTVPARATLGEVARTIRARNVGSAVVLDADGAPVGLISERELVDSVAASRNPDQGQAGSWLRTAGMDSISPQASLVDASRAMRDAGVRHLTVIEDNAVVGVISIRDILAALD
jgi:signal-transduction protein with cAMP-binding, CBS, and nucleotidyltransferase domain